jgi:GT2 family glycosyltransferase
MKLSVVIVNYNVRELLSECIKSVNTALTGIDGDIYVVDNNSSDGSVAYIRDHFPDVHVIANSDNQGFAHANNQAIRQTNSDYVLLLNPDTVVFEGTLRGCVDFMDAHPQCGGVGVRMLTREGTVAPESRRAIPTPWVAFLKMLGFTRKYYMSHLPWDKPGQIEVISGAFCMLRHKALDQIGLLDEDFFMYGEDIDLSYRLLKGGWENWFLPYDIIHYKGESTQKSSFRYVHVFYQAMLIFFRKHYAHLSFLISLPIQAAIYFRALMALLQMLGDKFRTFLNPTKTKTIS